MKKAIPLVFSSLCLLIIVFFWDFIKIPYDHSNTITGEAFNKKINPTNDTIRFVIIFFTPLFIYLISYLKINNNIFGFNKENYFLNFKKKNNSDDLNKIYYLFLFIIIFEFLNIDFNKYLFAFDKFHDGTYLVTFMNHFLTKEILSSSIHNYGLIANHLVTIFYSISGFFSVGSILFIQLILIFLLKFFLLLISKKLINLSNFKKNLKIIFFILLAFVIISLPNYNDFYSYFSPRQCFYLFFIYFLGSQLIKNNKNNFLFLLVGPLSFISVMWWFDIGIYTNAIIFLTILYMLIDRQIKNLIMMLLGIFFTWLLFFVLMDSENIKEFLFQLQIPFSKYIQYIEYLEFKKPFSPNSGRWTKAILLILFSGFMLINLNFNKKYNLDKRIKIFINLIFISSIFLFKSALVRSDSYHLKYTSGLYTLIFLFLILFFMFDFFEKKKFYKNKYLILKNVNFNVIFFILLLFFYFFNFSNNKITLTNFNSLLNFSKVHKNINTLLTTKDEKFLNSETQRVIEYYKQLSKNDDCVQILTDDFVFSYFLKKKTCTQFWAPTGIHPGIIEGKFISQLSRSSPSVILFESKNKIQTDLQNKPKIIEYIEDKYEYFNDINGYVFYKLKTN